MNSEILRSLLDKANVEFSTGNHSEAEKLATEVFEKSAVKNGTITDDYTADSLRANSMLLLATIANIRGNWDDVMKYTGEALAIAEHHSLPKIKIGMWNILGNLYRLRGYYERALEYFEKALGVCVDSQDTSLYALVNGNIGIVHASRGTYDKALEYFSLSLSAYEKLGEQSRIAIAIGNIGNVYSDIGRSDQALVYFYRALAIREELGEKSGIAYVKGNIGLAYLSLGDYDKALEFFYAALAIHSTLKSNPAIALSTGNIGMVYQRLNKYSKALEYYGKSLEIRRQLDDKSGIARILEHIGTLYSDKDFEGYDAVKAEEYLLKALAIFEEIDSKHVLYLTYRHLATLYEQEQRWEESYFHYKKFHEIKEEVQSQETLHQAEQLVHERQIAEREKTLAVERARSQATDDILANILPLNIVERLIKGEKKIAETHESVTVLFIDIVGFTKMSALIPAGELIDLLDIIFSRFDSICKAHGLEKIKTIGDAYMAVCGAPIPCNNHAERAAYAALEMLEDWEIDRQFSTEIDLDFRIGLHTGSVVAGIIGENKYSYDLWGDAVNTASRMESHGEAGKIHVSEEFKHAVETLHATSLPIETLHATSLQFIRRGEMDIKGKGKMETYFLEKI